MNFTEALTEQLRGWQDETCWLSAGVVSEMIRNAIQAAADLSDIKDAIGGHKSKRVEAETTFSKVEVGQYFIGSGGDLLRRVAAGTNPDWPRANFYNPRTGLFGACGPDAPVTAMPRNWRPGRREVMQSNVSTA